MPVGIDTGFFYALKHDHPVAKRVWQEKKEIITCALVLYELQKKLLN
jgi:predicted nucleic acid-binding protein